jgi:hypothetical protein
VDEARLRLRRLDTRGVSADADAETTGDVGGDMLDSLPRAGPGNGLDMKADGEGEVLSVPDSA